MLFPLHSSSYSNVNIVFRLDGGYKWFDGTFSDGDFKVITANKTTERATTSEKAEEKKDEDRPSEDIDYSRANPCPQEGRIRVFQKLSNLERHLSVEKCSRSLERLSLLDLAKTEYAAVLQEGVSTMPTLEPTSTHSLASASPKEGWALKESRKAYRFNEKQRSYLEAKFNLGQSTGRKVDPDFVAKEMRRALDSDGKRLFRPSDLNFSQCNKSRLFLLDLRPNFATKLLQRKMTFALWRRRQTFKRQEKRFYPRLK